MTSPTIARVVLDTPLPQLDRLLDYAGLIAKLHAPGNGLNDIYQVDIDVLGLKH